MEITDRQRIMQHLQTINYTDNVDDTDSDTDDFDELFIETGEYLDFDDFCLLEDVDYENSIGSHVSEFCEYADELEDECDCINEEDQMSVNEEDDCISVCTEYSFNAPPHSPLSPSGVVCMDLDDNDSLTAVSSNSLNTNDNGDNNDGVNSVGLIQNAESWKGFKVVGDNLDKNIKPSFKRFANKTNSLHYFHHYALLDRVDFSGYSEYIPNDSINLKKLLISRSDVAKLESDAIILFSRLVNT